MTVPYFADANLPPRAAELLEVFDRRYKVIHHNTHFQEATPDVEWLAELAKWNPKPIVLCGDARILRNPKEKIALREADLTFVVFAKGWTNESWDNLAWKLIKVWPIILRETKVSRPTIFEVSIMMKVERIRFTSEHR